VHALAAGIAATLDGAADRLAGRTPPSTPALPALLADAETEVARVLAQAGDAGAVAHVEARLTLYGDLVGRLEELVRDLDVRQLGV
jgi:hypothetical protein